MELNDINKQFGAKVKEIRGKLGLSQEKFGRLVGIHKQQVSRYERGKALPRANIREKILAYEPLQETAFLKVSEPQPEWQTKNSSQEKRLPENHSKRKFINKILRILQSGNEKAINALQSNVEAFLDMVERGKPEPEEGG